MNKKFNFVPESQIVDERHKDHTSYATITKTGLLNFSVSAVRNLNLSEKYIRLYVDVNQKTIGFTIFEGQLNDKVKLRKLAKRKGNDAIIGINKILQLLKVDPSAGCIRLPIQEYNDLLEKNKFYYIQLK